jgi:hypothetical protein
MRNGWHCTGVEEGLKKTDVIVERTGLTLHHLNQGSKSRSITHWSIGCGASDNWQSTKTTRRRLRHATVSRRGKKKRVRISLHCIGHGNCTCCPRSFCCSAAAALRRRGSRQKDPDARTILSFAGRAGFRGARARDHAGVSLFSPESGGSRTRCSPMQSVLC